MTPHLALGESDSWMMDSATPPAAARRMIAFPKVYRFLSEMKGRFSPVLVEQILITWRYLPVSLSQTRGI